MVDLTIRNEDTGEEAGLSLQEIACEKNLDDDEIRKRVHKFQDNLRVVIDYCSEDQYVNIKFLGIKISPILGSLVTSYVIALIGTAFYRLT